MTPKFLKNKIGVEMPDFPEPKLYVGSLYHQIFCMRRDVLTLQATCSTIRLRLSTAKPAAIRAVHAKFGPKLAYPVSHYAIYKRKVTQDELRLAYFVETLRLTKLELANLEALESAPPAKRVELTVC